MTDIPRPDLDQVRAVLDEIPGLADFYEACQVHLEDDAWFEGQTPEQEYAYDWARWRLGELPLEELQGGFPKAVRGGKPKKPQLVSKPEGERPAGRKRAIASRDDVAVQAALGRAAWEKDPRPSRVGRECLAYLWGEAVDTGWVYLARGIKGMADELDHSETAVAAAMVRLERAGYVKRWRSNKHGGNFKLDPRCPAHFYTQRAGRQGSGGSFRSPVSIWWLKQPWHTGS